MSFGSKTAGVLTGATNILLGTSFRTPSLGDFSPFGSSKKGGKGAKGGKGGGPVKTPKPESSEISKKELAEISSILSDIKKSLNSYLAASAIAPKMLLDMQAERKNSAEFLSGMVEGMRAEIVETGQEGNESLNAFLDGFAESIKTFVENSAFLPQLQESTEDLSDSIQNLTEAQENPESRLAEDEARREGEQTEEKRHNKLIDTLLAIATLGFLNSKSKKKDGDDSGSSSFLGGLLGGALGKGGLVGLLAGFAKFALVVAGIGLLIAGLIGAFTFIKMMVDDPEKFKKLFGDPEFWKEKLTEALSWVGGAIWGALTSVGEKIMELGAAFRTWLYTGPLLGGDSLSIKDIVEKISDLFSWETIKESFDTAVAITKNKFNELKESFLTKYEEIKESISSTFQSIRETVGSAIQSVKDGVQGVIDGVLEKFDEVKEKIIGIYRSIVDGIIEKIESIKEGFGEFKEQLKAKFEEFSQSLASFFDPEMWKQKAIEQLDAAKEEIGRIYSESMERIQEFIGEAGKAITEFFTGIVDTIKTIFGDIGEFIKGAKEGIAAFGASLFSKEKENEADANMKIIDEEDKKLKERISVLGRGGGRAGESDEQKERKRAEIEQYEKRREELKAARDIQESTHKRSLNNIDKHLETATGLEKEELLAQRQRIVDAAKEDARIAVGDALDPTKMESIGEIEPPTPEEEKPERKRGPNRAEQTEESSPEELIPQEEPQQPAEERKPTKGRGAREKEKEKTSSGIQPQDAEEKKEEDLVDPLFINPKPNSIEKLTEDGDILAVEDPLFIKPKTSPIEKLDIEKDPKSLYTEFLDESIKSMTDASAKDAASIVSGSSSVSIDQTLKDQKQLSQSSSTTVTTTVVSPIFPRGVIPGLDMNQ